MHQSKKEKGPALLNGPLAKRRGEGEHRKNGEEKVIGQQTCAKRRPLPAAKEEIRPK